MIVAVLDNVRSALNVGSIFRTADSFGVNELIICGISATPPSREIHKTALGADQSVKYRYFASTVEALDCLRVEGFELVAVEQADRSVDLREMKLDRAKNYAFVLGNEVDGVSAEALAMCDTVVEIEQQGIKKSLNVSVAAGVVLWCASNSLK